MERSNAMRCLPVDPVLKGRRRAGVSEEVGPFASAHVLINYERKFWGLPSLQRSCSLDTIARMHAEKIASLEKVEHSTSTLEELQEKLESTVVGENVHVGEGVRQIHDHIMKVNDRAMESRRNVLTRKFREVGVGTAKAADGRLYVVQLFRG